MHLPPVRCHYSRLARVAELKLHPANPLRHPPEQLRLYAKIIAHAGWRWPITVSKRSGRVTHGHGALEVARAAGWPKVPIEIQAYADAGAELADLLADNQLARYATDDQEALEAIEASLRAQGFDLELAAILPEDTDPETPDAAIAPPPLQILISCQTESQQVTLLRTLTAQGLTVRAQIS